jgi:peptide/nickel transport system permease protein
LVIVLFVLSLLLFLWLRSLPGGPVSAILGQRATPEKVAELNATLGLDQNVFVQYLSYMGRVLQGNFGQSTGVAPGTPALDVFFLRFGATIELTVGAMILALAFGIPLGYMAAKRRGGTLDNSAIVFSLIGIAVPRMGRRLGFRPAPHPDVDRARHDSLRRDLPDHPGLGAGGTG